jgi:anti-sigma B factor antagonist
VDGRWTVVALKGDLDLSSAPSLKWALADLLDRGHSQLVIDLSQVGFMDSTALSVLVVVKRSLPDDGLLTLAAASPGILKLFEVTGLDQAFNLFSTVDDALAYLREPHAAALPSAAAPLEQGEEELATEPDPGLAERASPGALLSDDAAVVLALAATALPFARSPQAQVQRWLRALRQHGDAGVVLAALGVTDESPDEGPGSELETPPTPGPKLDRDVVTTVTEEASRIAAKRGANAIHTIDVLGAVEIVYGADFEVVAEGHRIPPPSAPTRGDDTLPDRE